ncbi:hypothetical protein V8G54_019378 [Vigna mungo]|uniref:Transmembrane protein n=1 Tax=Vigna mungo TaxID=3915 RepID=A0AAQ3RTP4_VIGMU
MALSKRMILLAILLIIFFTIFVAFPQPGAACRTLQEDQWLRQSNGILLQVLPRGPVKPSSPDPPNTYLPFQSDIKIQQKEMALSLRRVLFIMVVMIFTILVCFPEVGAAGRALAEDQWLRENNGIMLLQSLPRGPLKPSSPDPIHP